MNKVYGVFYSCFVPGDLDYGYIESELVAIFTEAESAKKFTDEYQKYLDFAVENPEAVLLDEENFSLKIIELEVGKLIKDCSYFHYLVKEVDEYRKEKEND